MNLNKLNDILNAANIAGMDKIVIKRGSSGNTVHGISPDQKIILFSPVEGATVTDQDVGIHKVGALLTRLKLVNFEHAKVEVAANEKCAHSITIKEGRKKVDFTFADPAVVKHPQAIAQDMVRSKVILSKESANEFLTALSAMNPKNVILEGRGDDILVSLFDGTTDYFENKVGDNTAGDWKKQWNATSVSRLVKYATKDSENVEMGISDHGFLYITVSGLCFMVVPEVER